MRGTLAKGLLVVLVALLVGAAAYVFSQNQPEEYRSQTSFAFGPLLSPEFQVIGGAGEPDLDDDVRIATEASLINSFDIAEATARRAPELGMSAGEIAGRVSATPDRGSLVVLLIARASSPRLAERLANAYAGQYIARKRAREKRRAAIAKRALETRLESLPRGDRRGPVGAGIRDQISTLDVLLRVGSGVPQRVEAARASSVPAQPQTQRNVLFGLLFGIAVGVGLVALRTESRARAATSASQGATGGSWGDPALRK